MAKVDNELAVDAWLEGNAKVKIRSAPALPVDLGRYTIPKSSLDAVIEAEVEKTHRVFWGDRLLTLDKSAGFLDDPVFSAAFEAIKGSHEYDQFRSPHTIAWRLHTLVWAARQAIALPGDFVECGVFKGDFSWVVATVMGEALRDRTFWLYDSFEGFSPDFSSADDYPDNPGFLAFANSVYSAPDMEADVRARFSAMDHVKIVSGFLPSTLLEDSPDRIAFLHVDLNAPKAEVACLEILFDRIVPGGVIVFDDYGWHLFREQKRAEDEFFAARGYYVLELPTGQGLVVKRP